MSDDIDELRKFREGFLNEIAIEAQAGAVFNEERFIERVVDVIAEDGQIQDNPSFVNHVNKPTKIHGYSFSELDGSLSVFIANFFHVNSAWENPQPLSEVKKFINRPKRFIEKSMTDNFLNTMESVDADHAAALSIKRLLEAAKIKAIKIYYFTDGIISERTKEYQIEDILSIPTVIKPYGIRRFYEIDLKDSGTEDFSIDFEKHCNGLDGLATNLEGLQSFMVVMPGSVLSKIYGDIGQKLLESNVRNFLNFTGKTNRGIKETLLKETSKFFAYNNGLTVTATKMDADYSGSAIKIKSLENMQIVNGGQTTCVIFFAPQEKNFKNIDLSKVSVPMKLTIINAGVNATPESLEEADEFKSNVANYANQQNAVSSADLMSNSPFHIRLEQASRRTVAPMNDLGISNFWFYERTKGQWNTQKRLATSTPQFLKKFPKNQLIHKADLARYENTWRTKPYDVSKGAAKNLSSLYAGIIEEFRDKEDRFRDQFFKSIVAKKIIYNKTERIISNSDWFISTTYIRPYVTTYSLALMLFKLREQGQDLNIERVWINQSIDLSLESQIEAIAKMVNSKLMDPSFTNNTTAAEWAKKLDCWKKFIAFDLDLSLLSSTDVLSSDELEESQEEGSELGEVAGIIEGMEKLMRVSKEEFIALIDFHYEKGYRITDPEIGLPTKGLNMHITGALPSDLQLQKLLKIYNKAHEDGFIFYVEEK